MTVENSARLSIDLERSLNSIDICIKIVLTLLMFDPSRVVCAYVIIESRV